MQSQSQWYWEQNRPVPPKSAQEVFKAAITVFQFDPNHQANFDKLQQLQSINDLVLRIKRAQSRYDLQHQDHKAAKWLSKLSSRIGYYGRVLDVLVQHHPEYVSLAWGAMKFLFILVENHGKQVNALAKGLARIADVLPRVEFANTLYSTQRMQDAVFEIYNHVITFFVRAERWYQHGKLRHAWEAFCHPVELVYDDLIAEVEECTTEIEKLATAGAQAEQRDMHLRISDISAKLQSHEDLLRAQEALLLEMRGLLISQQAIQASANLDTNQRLTDLQLNHIMDFLSGKDNLDALKILQYRSFALARFRSRQRKWETSTTFWTDPKFSKWDTSLKPSLIVVKGNYTNRQEVQSFTVDVIQQLCNEKIPVLWVLRPTPTHSARGLSVTDVIKSLVCQAMKINISLHAENLLARSCARFRAANTPDEWLDLLACAIATLPRLYIIIDMETVDRTYCDGFPWISRLYAMFQRHVSSKWISRLKILLVSYSSHSAYTTDLVSYRDVLVLAQQHSRSRNTKTARPGSRYATVGTRKLSKGFAGG